MKNLIIEPYIAERDKASITAILRENEHLNAPQLDDKMAADLIFVARYDDETVAFLSFDRIRRNVFTTMLVDENHRRRGIGTELMAKANEWLSQNERVESSLGSCKDGDRSSLQFLYKHGYYISYSSYIMEREGLLLPEGHISVRPYEDDDYEVCHHIYEIAFYQMHERIGVLPTYYYPPNENERGRFAKDKDNRFVMRVDDEIVGVGIIDGSELSHVSVRPNVQSRGYGKDFVSFLVNEIIRRGEKTVKLAVVKGNPAINLYDRLGFKEKALSHFVTKYYRPDTRLSRPPSDLYQKMTL